MIYSIYNVATARRITAPPPQVRAVSQVKVAFYPCVNSI